MKGLPKEMLLVPLLGHTLGRCGVTVNDGDGWLLHAGDVYFDPREVNGPQRRCAWKMGLFQTIVQTDRRARLHNQTRLRALTTVHPDTRVFSAHNPFEFPPASRVVGPPKEALTGKTIEEVRHVAE